MSGAFSGRSRNASQITAYTGIQLQTSAQGLTVPVYYGSGRAGVNLLWYSGFNATPVSSGGKGGALGGGAGKNGTVSGYRYTANVILGICEGPVLGYGQAWASKTPTTPSALGLTEFLGTYPQTAWGFVTTNYPTQARPYTGLGYMAGASYELGAAAELPQHTFEVYGFFSQRTVYTAGTIPGSGPFTIGVGQQSWGDGSTHSVWSANIAIPGFTLVGGPPGAGQYSVAAGVYTFNSANAGQAVTIQWTGNGQDADPSLVINDILTNIDYGVGFSSGQVGEVNTYTEASAIPGGPHQITVTHASGFDDNLSVYDAANDQLFTCVASSPGPLQYSYAAGLYTFHVADVGKTVSISYAANVGLLTYQAYCWAAGFFISPGYSAQQGAAAVLDEIAKFTNSEILWSGGALRLVPRGDQALSANGYVYTPPAATVADMTDDNLVANTVSGGASGAVSGNDPVVLTRKRVSAQKNVVQVECLDRTNQYNTAVVEATDQAMVDLFGRRTTGAEHGHLFCDVTAARVSVQLLLQREAIRNTYAFVLPATFVYLDPMDLVSITDARLGLTSSDWMRITSIEEQSDGTLHVMAEEYGNGSASIGTYQFSQGAGYAANYNVDPGNINTPIVFEPPVQLATNSGLEIWGAFSGSNPNWGGCDIYVSTDGGANYSFIGRKWGASRQGVLTANFSLEPIIGGFSGRRSQRARLLGSFATGFRNVGAPGGFSGDFQSLRIVSRVITDMAMPPLKAPPDPDTADVLHVDLSESYGQLVSGTSGDADVGNTACIVDSEILSFSSVTLTGSYQYDLGTYLRRGQFGTAIASHASGAPFARLDENIFSWPYDKGQVGQTIFVKACSFNKWGGGLQDISVVTGYAHSIGGPPTPGIVTRFTGAQVGLTVNLSWVDLNDVSVKGYDILYSAQGAGINAATLLTTASRTTETTTAAVGAGSWTFYIRARNIADQTGPVSSFNISLNVFSQTFDQSGTWTKPSGLTTAAFAIIEVWAAGGGGGSGGGGGGGGYNVTQIACSSLLQTVTVSIGFRGQYISAFGLGSAGSTSSFGSYCQAFGGGGGYQSGGGGGGGGGGQTSVGQQGVLNGGDAGGPAGGKGGIVSTGPAATGGFSGGGGADGGALTGADGMWGGGGGGSGKGGGSPASGGLSVMGGGGGGGNATGSVGGASNSGGTGGTGGASPTDGTQPGGGGGYTKNGGDGRVRITIIP